MTARLLSVALLLSLAYTCAAQQANVADIPVQNRRIGEMLIQLAPQAKLSSVLSELNALTSNTANISLKRTVSDNWHMYLIGFDEQVLSAAQLLSLARKHPGIDIAQLNHQTKERDTEPNDPEWWRQDNMTLINAQKAWDASTGGVTPAGDTIVVAVLERGVLFSHPDLAPNRWWNWNETPNDGIDNDNNGYVDDFGGWNPRNQNDDIGNQGVHGTQVYGIIGAAGNNLVGVSGVSWNVKMMNLGDVQWEDEVIAAYEYVAAQRRLYNQTNGAKGAFVVATNASLGLDNERAEDHQLWCAMYDSLGKVGVISVGSTANKKCRRRSGRRYAFLPAPALT